MDDLKSKFFLRSRAIQAAIILLSQGIDGLALQLGIDLPTGLVGYVQNGLDAITGDQGLGAILIDAYAGILVVWHRFRDDAAKLTFLPFAKGNAPLGQAMPLALVLALLSAWMANPARAATVPYQPEVRFAWAPSTGPVVGYRVYVYQDGSEALLVNQVTAPEARFAVDAAGASLAVQVVPIDAAGTTGPPSDVSEELIVLAQAPAPGSPLVTAEDGRLCLTAPTDDSLGNPIAAGAPNAIVDCTLAVTDAIGHEDTWTDPYDAGQTRCFNHQANRGAGEAVGTCRNALGPSAEARVAVTFPPQIVYGPPAAPSVGLPVP